MRLLDNLRERKTAVGSLLVTTEQGLSPARLPPPPDAPPRWRWAFATLGITLALVLPLLQRALPRTAAVLIGAWWLLLGVIGLGLAALWALSAHRAGYGNENLLLFNPLCLGLLPLTQIGRAHV